MVCQGYLKENQSSIQSQGRIRKATVYKSTLWIKDPDDKHHWIIEETAANVVRRIFNLCVD